MEWFESFFVMPYSTLFTFFINICVVLVGSFIFRMIINVNRLEAQEFEVRSYDRSFKIAKKNNDKSTLRRLKREEVRIKRISASASRQRLRVVIITILPFTVVSIMLSIIYAGKEVALFPFEFLFFNRNFSFSIWYFLTYLTAYLPLSRVFRTSPNLWQSYESKSG